MALKLTCPQCGQRMTMDFSTSRVFCKACGYVRPDEIANLEKKVETVKMQGTAVPYVALTHRGEVTPAVRAAFDTGIERLNRGDRAGALGAFARALDYQPDFTDAHLWIAKVTTDPKVQRDHLETILANTPNHLEATRMMMVLTGRLTPEQAARTYHDNEPMVRQAEGPVAAKSTELLCPSCGGHLTVNEQTQRVECRFCGYRMPEPTPEVAAASQGDVLMAALLERKAKPIRWNVGKRLVKCQECGAEHTIPAEHMAQRCRFCGSMAVILSDALGSFEQPDGLIPPGLTAEQAMDAINQQLGSLTERIKGFFDTNKVVSSVIDGVYLPYWVFDASVNITKNVTRDMLTETTTTQDGMWDVAVCASKSLPRALTGRIESFDSAAAVPYEPHWLAKFPAQLYTIDFDAASLDARAVVGKTMRARYEAEARAQAGAYTNEDEHKPLISIFTAVQTMTFRLLLLPVWIALLTEQDGDRRIGLVNAQTGAVALGKTQKPPKH